MDGAWFDEGESGSEYEGALISFSVKRKTPSDDIWVATIPRLGGLSRQVIEFDAQSLEDAKLAVCLRIFNYMQHVGDDVANAMKLRRRT